MTDKCSWSYFYKFLGPYLNGFFSKSLIFFPPSLGQKEAQFIMINFEAQEVYLRDGAGGVLTLFQ